MTKPLSTPLVAILCLTYNHEKYIRDALNGFVIQQTDFPFVVIVHDDASTDDTQKIIREFQERYPEIIKPIYETENQYSKKDGSLSRIMRRAAEVSGATYIAQCEGDDYWIDAKKLQTQVNFLQAHPDYSMCFHAVKVVQEGTSNVGLSVERVEDREYTSEEILGRWIVPTCSVLTRRDCILNKPVSPSFLVGDNVLWANCLSKGRVWGLSKVMGVYRRVPGGWTEQASSSRMKRYRNYFGWIKHYQAMKNCFPEIDNKIFDKQIVNIMSKVSVLDILLLKKDFFHNFKVFYREYRYTYAKKLIVSLIEAVKYRLFA